MATLRPNWPPGLPSPEALLTATDALRRQYVLSGTVLHPVIAGQAIELAYLLCAYGLVPAERRAAPARSYGTLESPRTLPRAAGFRVRLRRAGQHVLLDTATDAMN